MVLPMAVVALFFNTRLLLFLNDAEDVYTLLSEVENTHIDTNTLLLGDSVCRLFFGKKKDGTTYSLCENQSYEIPGNYLLLKTLLEKGARFDTLVLVMNPKTLPASLNQPYTYNYFVRPFKKYLHHLDPPERAYINKTYPTYDVLKYKFSNFELSEAFDIADQAETDSISISATNRKYLIKMDSTCRAENIKFKMICPPLPASIKTYMRRFNAATKKTLASYFDSAIYYDSIYSKDGLHHNESETYYINEREKLDDLLKL